jgi:hypothetical protein
MNKSTTAPTATVFCGIDVSLSCSGEQRTMLWNPGDSGMSRGAMLTVGEFRVKFGEEAQCAEQLTRQRGVPVPALRGRHTRLYRFAAGNNPGIDYIHRAASQERISCGSVKLAPAFLPPSNLLGRNKIDYQQHLLCLKSKTAHPDRDAPFCMDEAGEATYWRASSPASWRAQALRPQLCRRGPGR